jgi:hypothetical protein
MANSANKFSALLQQNKEQNEREKLPVARTSTLKT